MSSLSMMVQKLAIAKSPSDQAKKSGNVGNTPQPDDESKDTVEQAALPSFHSILYHVDSYHHYESDSIAHLHRAIVYRLHFNILSIDNFSKWGEVCQTLNNEYQQMKSDSHDCLISPKYYEQIEAYQLAKQNNTNTGATLSNTNKATDTDTSNEIDSTSDMTKEDINAINARNTSGIVPTDTKTATNPNVIFDIHTDVIQRQLILKDMQRLFLNGVDNGYFQTDTRRNILQNVLCLWCSSKGGTYKQGMHEIAAVILLIVENECDSFQRFRPENPSQNASKTGVKVECNDDIDDNTVKYEWFSDKEHIEMHTFFLFDKIMQSLGCIYAASPGAASTATNSADATDGGAAGDNSDTEKLTMSAFLNYIQDVVVKELHPRLWEHLKICHIDPQLYGTSWCRLLFGRIFLTNNAEQLSIWDYLFAPTVKSFPKLPFMKPDIPLGPYGSEYLVSKGGGRVNQFGLTDTSDHFTQGGGKIIDDDDDVDGGSKGERGGRLRQAGSFSDGDDNDNDDDDDENDDFDDEDDVMVEGWSLKRPWKLSGFQNKKKSFEKEKKSSSAISSSSKEETSSNITPTLNKIDNPHDGKDRKHTEHDIDEKNVDLKETEILSDGVIDDVTATDSVHATDNTSGMKSIEADRETNSCPLNSSDDKDEGNRTQDVINDEKIQCDKKESNEAKDVSCEVIENAKNTCDNEDKDEDMDGDTSGKEETDWFETNSYVTSEDREHDTTEEEDECSEDSDVEEWPFAKQFEGESGQEVLLKIGCVSVAIVFKIRESLLRSSELDTITTLLRPLEPLRAVSRSNGGGLGEFVFDLIRLSQQFESCVSSKCTLQPIPLHATSDIMDFHNIRSATYSLNMLGAPTWRDASMAPPLPSFSNHNSNANKLNSNSSSLTNRTTPASPNTQLSDKGWYLGKYLGKIVASGRNSDGKSNSLSDNEYNESIEQKMMRKKQLLKDYYSEYNASEGFSAEFSVVSDLPVMTGWLRKKKPRGPLINYNKWKRRFIVLTRETLSYYTNDTYEELRGQFFLSPGTKAMVEDGTTEKHRIKFMIEDPHSKQKVRFFLVESEEMRALWVNRINKAVEMLIISEQEGIAELTPTVDAVSPLSRSTTTTTTSSSGSSNGQRNGNGRSNGDCQESSDEDEKVFNFSTDFSFCRNMLVADDLQSYHYASGWLKKKNLIGGSWRLLFFELLKTEILFYTETANVAAKCPLGRIQITPHTVILNRSYGKTKHKFAISTPIVSSASTTKRITFQTLFGSGSSNSGSGNSGNSGSSPSSKAESNKSGQGKPSPSSPVTTNNINSSSGGSSSGKSKVFYCAASSEEEKEQWMAVIRDAVAMLSNNSSNTAKSS